MAAEKDSGQPALLNDPSNPHWQDGFLSYPDRRLNYPSTAGDDEKYWLGGWHAARQEAQNTIALHALGFDDH